MTQKQTDSRASTAKSPQTKRYPRRADARRSLQATMVCVGVLSIVLVMFAHAQVPRNARKVSGVVVAAATQQPIQNAHVEYKESGRSPETTITDTKRVL